jgi:hypothetical protein
MTFARPDPKACRLGLAAYDYLKYLTAKYIRPVMFYLCR